MAIHKPFLSIIIYLFVLFFEAPTVPSHTIATNCLRASQDGTLPFSHLGGTVYLNSYDM